MLAVEVSPGQLLTTNLLASTTAGAGFSILGPDETVAPESEAWRAVSLTVSDDRAVGGMLGPGMTVDVFMTRAASTSPQSVLDEGTYYTDQSTKISYQDMEILSRQGTFYIVKAPLAGRRGDHPPPGRRQRAVQHGPAARRRQADPRRELARRDDQPDHRALRPAGPGDVPDGRRPDREPARRSRRSRPRRRIDPTAVDPASARRPRPRLPSHPARAPVPATHATRAGHAVRPAMPSRRSCCPVVR